MIVQELGKPSKSKMVVDGVLAEHHLDFAA
jgi:hypothetical protein